MRYTETIEKMVAEITKATIDDLEKIATTHDHPRRIAAHAVLDAAYLITTVEDDLRSKIEFARNDLDMASKLLDGHEGFINPSGVLQNTGREIDMLAARRSDAYARLKSACQTMTALPPRT